MKKVFVTAIGGDIGYGVIKALKKSNHDIYILGCDIKKYNISYDLVDEFLECPPYSNERAWTDFVLETITESSVDYFWPVTEPEIRIVDKKKMLFSDVRVVMTTIGNTVTQKYCTLTIFERSYLLCLCATYDTRHKHTKKNKFFHSNYIF